MADEHGIDIFGDLHGYSDILSQALISLGYWRENGCYRHTHRKAIFTGDLINKGPGIRETVSTVRKMVNAGFAECIAGNHEWSLLMACRGLKDHMGARGEMEKAQRMAADTLDVYGNDQEGLRDLLDWLSGLPLWIETTDYRIVHAAWIDRDISRLSGGDGTVALTLGETLEMDGPRAWSVRTLLNGIEWQLRNVKPTQGYRRNEMDVRVHRMKWWQLPERNKFLDIALRNSENTLVPVAWSAYREAYPGYPKDTRPVFFGHYCMEGEPVLMASNVCCLDWCIYRTHRLAVYSWSGERVLNPSHLRFFEGQS